MLDRYLKLNNSETIYSFEFWEVRRDNILKKYHLLNNFNLWMVILILKKECIATCETLLNDIKTPSIWKYYDFYYT